MEKLKCLMIVAPMICAIVGTSCHTDSTLLSVVGPQIIAAAVESEEIANLVDDFSPAAVTQKACSILASETCCKYEPVSATVDTVLIKPINDGRTPVTVNPAERRARYMASSRQWNAPSSTVRTPIKRLPVMERFSQRERNVASLYVAPPMPE